MFGGYVISDKQRDELNDGLWYFNVYGSAISVVVKCYNKSFRYKRIDKDYTDDPKGDKDESWKLPDFYRTVKEVEEVIHNNKIESIKRERQQALKTLEKYDAMLAEFTEDFI